MTCIAVITDGKKIVIGGDSAGTAGLSLTVHKDPKVFKREDESGIEWLFGFTGSFRMGELIQYELKLPKIKEKHKEDLYAFMVKKFIPALRGCLKKGGYARKQYNVEHGGTFIVGILGRIFKVDSDYQAAEPLDSFIAIGCGHDLAKGSLHTSEGIQDLGDRVAIALEAAQRFSAAVREPFIILETKSS